MLCNTALKAGKNQRLTELAWTMLKVYHLKKLNEDSGKL